MNVQRCKSGTCLNKSSIVREFEEHLVKFTEILMIKQSNSTAAYLKKHPTRLAEIVMIKMMESITVEDLEQQQARITETVFLI
jgi:hypothetical protein